MAVAHKGDGPPPDHTAAPRITSQGMTLRSAAAAFATLAGELSRAVDDPETSGEILAAARRHLTAPAN